MHRSHGLRAAGLSGCVAGFALAVAVWVAQPVQAASTPVALVAGSPELTTLAACMAERAKLSGPVLNSERLVDGLEFRLLLRSEPGAAPILIINGLLKPDVAGLIESHNHDDHPESQSAAATRFYRMLRIPLGSRAWVWQREQEKAICGEAVAWIERVRRRPINFDRIGPDGEPL
ncbi:MAG: hypothetical protein HZA59_01275 [Hydrogenophilales bacterium]|nr:hypothetical protein [Hydrogenophilales bacterium]